MELGKMYDTGLFLNKTHY